MSKKFRLFASVAAPFVSLPLMLQPAGATPMRPAMEAGQMPGVVQVQQQIIVPPGAPGAQEGEGQPRPRRKPPEEQQQAPAERPQAPPQAQQQEQPQRQRKAEPEAAPREAAPREAAPRQAPQAERPAAEAPAQERPRRQQQETGQGQGQGQGGNDALPRRQREQATPQTEPPAAREAQQPKAAPAEKQAETPKPERPATNRAATPEAAPEAPVRRDAQQPKAAPTEKQAETPKPQPPATNRAATPEVTPEKPTGGKQADTPKPPQAPATDRAATPGAAPENPARGNATGQAPVPVPGQAPGTGTAQDRRNQQPPVNGQAAPAQPPAGETPLRQSTEGQPAVAPSGQQATGAQPATQPSAPQTATTPQQVERAKELAKDPAAAKSGEQVVLPVQNGAAVLDSAKEAPSSRPLRDGERPRRQAPQQADQQQLAPPKSDAEAQGGTRATREQQQEFRQLSEERGQRLDQRPQFERPRGWDFRDAAGRDRNGGRDRDGGRVIISIDNQSVVRHDDSRRFYNDRDRAPQYEQLRDGRVREIIVRDDGTRIVTVRNSYGEIVQRSRIVRGGEEYVLYYSPELMDNRRGRDYVWRDPGDDLPPMRLGVPLNDYIIDTSTDPDRDYYEFLEQPPVERVERVYSLDEVRYSARIRDKVPRIDLDTVTFATGSAEIPMNQASSLRKVADAISKVLKRDPAETFLIEGHTDAVGADDANLVLSDERAESVARVLTDAFGIPPENLATQGYGERYLKVRTDGPEQENRRVTVRRITPLVKPVASNQ
ncbi:OmpA family protein [Neorhizobium galegae]|uniref:OmpA family protein n=1 Tax=Neorhizobium galegae TaxID=399 RepID=UPI002105691E|nr:OmpA family protein [Neorhizobium galegae]MCQ1764979.1 OmpA family protein [Neorhizobium galegae]MCQ1848899.1 OmpA family protein [Neorhizobium galegae]